MYFGFLHLHARKKAEPYPSPAPSKRLLDYLMYSVALLSPFALAPQVLSIFATREVSGLVLYSWILLGAVNTLWIIYGFTHRVVPIVISNSLFMLFHIAGVAGIILYR